MAYVLIHHIPAAQHSTHCVQVVHGHPWGRHKAEAAAETQAYAHGTRKRNAGTRLFHTRLLQKSKHPCAFSGVQTAYAACTVQHVGLSCNGVTQSDINGVMTPGAPPSIHCSHCQCAVHTVSPFQPDALLAGTKLQHTVRK